MSVSVTYHKQQPILGTKMNASMLGDDKLFCHMRNLENSFVSYDRINIFFKVVEITQVLAFQIFFLEFKKFMKSHSQSNTKLFSRFVPQFSRKKKAYSTTV